MIISYRFFIVVIHSFIFAVLASNLTLYSNDYYNYLEIFHSINESSTSRIEPLFFLVTKLASYIDLNFTIYWLLLSFLSFYIKLSILEKQKCSVMMLVALYILYFSSLGIIHEITQIRASIAIAFGCLFLYEWSSNKKIAAISFLLISIGMHYSAFLFLFSFAIRLGKGTLSFVRIVSLMFLAVMLPIIIEYSAHVLNAINPLFYYYLNNSENAMTGGVLSITTALAIMSLLPVFIFLRKYKVKGFLLYNFRLYIMGVMFLISFSFSPVISIRVYELLSFCLFIIVAVLFSNNEKYIGFVNINGDRGFNIIRCCFLIVLTVISLHRHVAFLYVHPILNFR